LACALLFLAWTAERDGDPLLYYGLWRSPLKAFSPLFESLPVVRQPAWTLLLVAVGVAAHLRAGALRRRAGPMDVAILVSFATIGFSFAWGVARGGNAYWAYYQLNSLLLMLFAALVLLAASKSSADLRALGVTIVFAALVRSGLALYFFFTYVRGREPYPPHMTSHDDSPLFVCAIVIIVSWALTRLRLGSVIAASATVLPILLAIKVNNRRVAWIELVAALAFLYLVQPDRRLRRRLNRALVLAAPILAAYVAVGWGRPGALFAPLRAFDSTAGDNQDASTMARNEENLNVILTYIQNPILGSGWGHPMLRVSSTFANFGGGFDIMYPFVPHNSLAALTAFSGIVGLLGILGVIPVASFLAVRASQCAATRIDHTAGIASVCFLPVFGLHAYADIGMQSLTNCLLLSVALAVAGRASVWTGAWPGDGGRPRRPLPPSSGGLSGSA
jgi:hypothetical protein